MSKPILDDRDDFFEQLELWGSFIVANLLWAILSIPLITLPATTAGLFAFMSQRAQGKRPELFQVFFSAARDYWLKAALLMLLNVIVGGIILVNVYAFSVMTGQDMLMLLSRSVTVFVAIMLLLTNLYAWSLLVVTDLPLRPLVLLSFRLVFTYPLRSAGVLIAALLPVVISLMLPQGVFALFTASAVTLIITRGTLPVIRPYMVL